MVGRIFMAPLHSFIEKKTRTACEFIVDFYHSIWIIISGSALFAQRAFCGYALFSFTYLEHQPSHPLSVLFSGYAFYVFAYECGSTTTAIFWFSFFFWRSEALPTRRLRVEKSVVMLKYYMRTRRNRSFLAKAVHFFRDDDRLISSVSKSEVPFFVSRKSFRK